MTFYPEALETLDAFLTQATAVVPYRDVASGTAPAGSVAMRHDVDHDIEKAVRFAKWESDRGYSSTYFILHSAPYWAYVYGEDAHHFYTLVRELVDLGHEVGIHNNALCSTNNDVEAAKELLIGCREELSTAIDEDYEIIGVADHGVTSHTNGDIWQHHTPQACGFEYEAYQLQRAVTTLISDNQGRWRAPLEYAQTFMLIHPVWWPI